MVDIGEIRESPPLSWAAVLAGGITTSAITLLLAALGVGLGLSAISPWAGEGVSVTTFKVGAGVYLVAVSMLASTVGGYLAGRLRTKWTGVHDHEAYFRDTANGLVVWAFATVLSAAALGGATTHILGGASAGLAPAGGAAASSGNPAEVYIDDLLRTDPGASGAAAAAAASASSTNAFPRAELRRILSPALQKGGDVSPADRIYVGKVVAARTGLSQAEADARVSEVIARAKKAADDARRAAASLALWLTASLLAGALASMLAAVEGGLLRDSKWYEPGWRTTVTRTHP
jgi:hypothetical protein